VAPAPTVALHVVAPPRQTGSQRYCSVFIVFNALMPHLDVLGFRVLHVSRKGSLSGEPGGPRMLGLCVVDALREAN